MYGILFDMNYSNIFCICLQGVKEIKDKMNKWYLIKCKNCCTVKEIIDKIKRQSTKWEKTLANYMIDEWLLPKMYK